MGHLGHKIKLIDRQFRSRMDKNLENLGITTAQMNVLCYMEHHTERNVTQKQLSEAFNVKHSTMAGILQRMVEKDLLEIRPNPDNKKSVIIKDFTPDEKEYFEKTLFKVFHNLLNDSSLSPEEKDLIERRFMEND